MAAKKKPAKKAQVLNANHPGTSASIPQEKYDLRVDRLVCHFHQARPRSAQAHRAGA